MEIIREVQDWEFAEEISPNEYETVEIQIDSEAEAIRQAQEWANSYNKKCVVSTSIRYESEAGVEDRGLVPSNPQPIIIEPAHSKAETES